MQEKCLMKIATVLMSFHDTEPKGIAEKNSGLRWKVSANQLKSVCWAAFRQVYKVYAFSANYIV